MSEQPVAVVVGGAGGIGGATVEELAARGWLAVLADREGAGAAGGSGTARISIDVRDEESVRRAFEDVLPRFGRLDGLVNAAGIQRRQRLADLDPALWADVLDVNLNGTLRCMLAAAPAMLAAGSGAIVNVVSVTGMRGAIGRGPYAASKAAAMSLTQTAAAEWAASGIRVNAVGPGFVGTEMINAAIEAGEMDVEPILARTPMHRIATPAEIARAIAFLLSADASFVTGQTLFVDGGFLIDYGIPLSDEKRDG